MRPPKPGNATAELASHQQSEYKTYLPGVHGRPLRAEAEKALRTLQAALDAVGRARPGAAGPAASPAADCLAAAAQRVSQEVAKCAVVFGMGGLSSDEAASLLGALCAAVRAFAAQCGAVAAAGGATLRVRRFYVSEHSCWHACGRLVLRWQCSLPSSALSARIGIQHVWGLTRGVGWGTLWLPLVLPVAGI